MCRHALAAVLVAAGFMLAGCGDDGATPPPTVATSPPVTTTTGAASPTTGATTSPTAGTMVTADLTDFTITLSQSSFSPGTYTFVAQEKGQFPHALAIKGPGVESQTPTIQSGGASQQLTVTLQNGTYELWCPVGNHKERGMVTTITVS